MPSGSAPTWCCPDSPFSSRPSVGTCSSWRRHRCVRTARVLRLRECPVPVTAATTSGTPKSMCCPSSPTRRRSPRATRCGSATPCSSRHAPGQVNSTSLVPSSRGARSTASSRRPTTPLAQPSTISTPISRMRSASTSRPPATRTSSPGKPSIFSSRPHGCGPTSGSGAPTGTTSSTSTASPARTSTPLSSTTTCTRTSWRARICAQPRTPSSDSTR